MTDRTVPYVDAELIRAAIADAVQVCAGPLIDHAASGVLYALEHVTVPPVDGAPGPARTAAEEWNQAADDRKALRDQYVAAVREAACTGDCGMSELDCARQRIQPEAWHHGVLAEVSGSPEVFADVVLAVRDSRVEELEARVVTLEHVAAGNKRHVQAIVPELDRAEAVVARVRALAAEWESSAQDEPVPALGYDDAAARLRAVLASASVGA